MHRTHDPGTNQPYGRRTRSQQALHARAYRKNTTQVSNTIDLFIDGALVLDLEAAFKHINISQNIEKEVCKQCPICDLQMPSIYTRDAVLISILIAYQY